MFLEELTPVITQLIRQPAAFLGGFCTGILQLNLGEEPLKTWLTKQEIFNSTDNFTSDLKPRSIDID